MIFTQREIAQLRHLELLAAKVMKGQLHGEREMMRAGPGSGFREHRHYGEGDPLRMVDWHVYARTDQLVVKEFDAEEGLDIVLVQDRSASMRGAAALGAAKVAGALGAISLSQLERVVWIPAGGSRTGELFTGRTRLMDFLSAMDGEADGETDLLGAARQLRHPRGGVAFVVSDFFDPTGGFQAISFLLAHRYQVRAILIEDQTALAPPPLGRSLLVDAETGRTIKLDVTAETIDAYHTARVLRVNSLQGFCRRSGAGFLRVRADQPFFETVRTIIARGWLSP